MGPFLPPTQWILGGGLPNRQNGKCSKVTTHLHQMPRLRMHGVIPPFLVRLHCSVLKPLSTGIYLYPRKKVKLLLCLINQVLCREDICGSGGIAPTFLTSALDGVVSFKPQQFYPPYPFDKRLGGPRSRSERCGVEKISCLCRQSNPRPPAHSPSLYRFSYLSSCLSLLTCVIKETHLPRTGTV
jgi:hypothetical protein